MSLKRKALLVKAKDDPMPGIPYPGPHQRYRHPRLEIVTRRMKVLQPGYVRLKVILVGVCGTDIHLLQTNKSTGYVSCSAPASIPQKGRILGHECVGQIVEVGEAVTGLRPGDIVACESIISCGVCIPCRQGAFNQCSRARLLGMEEDGIFATYADLPQRICHPIEGLEQKPHGLVQAVCLEPAAVAYVAFEHARVHSSERILIFGGGPIGLFLAMLAKYVFGSLHVELIEPLKLRRELASRWADQVFTPKEFWGRKPLLLSSYDAVFEASGELENVSRIISCCGPRARIVLLARSGRPLKIDAVDWLITNAISILGSRGHLGGAFGKLIHLCLADRLPLHEVVTTEITGIKKLKDLLLSPQRLPKEHGKVIVRIAQKLCRNSPLEVVPYLIRDDHHCFPSACDTMASN